MYLRDFQCACGHRQEETFKDYAEFLELQGKVKCLNCGDIMYSLCAGSSFQLVGSGWAKDGYS